MYRITTEDDKRQSYFAKALVFTELFSIVQSTVNLHGAGISYLNLIAFFVLCMPVLLILRFSLTELIFSFLFVVFVLVKIVFQGVGEYYQKALLLLLLLPIYAVVARRVSMQEVAEQCFIYRKFILLLGGVYIVSWFFWGTYRNASTITIFVMLALAYRNKLDFLLSLIFASVMKTQYKFWVFLSFGGLIFSSDFMRSLLLLSMGVLAIFIPVALVHVDLGDVGFSVSQLSSLEERLKEVRSFVALMMQDYANVFWGWSIGQLIENEGLSDRGYMHSAYLWIIGSMGVPFSLLLFFYMFLKKGIVRKFILVRSFLILSNAFTFLLLTNPLCTVLMFSDERKK